MGPLGLDSSLELPTRQAPELGQAIDPAPTLSPALSIVLHTDRHVSPPETPPLTMVRPQTALSEAGGPRPVPDDALEPASF